MFIINQHGHYFKVNCEFNAQNTYNCRFFASLEELHKVVADEQGLDLDEVEGYEIVIGHDGESYTIFEFGFSCNELEPQTTIEEFVSDYML